ncbi:tellurite resistance/C4-dicarboxylate transporter family protein [Saccharopolyspora thermophila]|uniref:tellurite resistance/C4-dicarboxylate transporter family protein n=1 Tax=Saccharopolyspora thermophila TaxID=89367 RepID=UPI0031F95051
MAERQSVELIRPMEADVGRWVLPDYRVGRARWWRVLRGLNPGVFAFVMATGIVSIGLDGAGVPVASDALLLVGLAGYVVLVVVSGWRLLRWPRQVVADVVSARGFTFLTFVAASDVLAARLALDGWWRSATAFLIVGVLAYLVLGYGVPLGMIAEPRRHPTLDQVNGTWFMWVVGTQSVAVAAATLAPSGPTTVLAVVGLVCWATGLVLYLLLAGLGLARLLVRPVDASELVPPYWIFMGAAAITVLAGTRLVTLPDATQLLSRDLFTGTSVVLWSFCSWLIPLLVALGVWRHIGRREPLRYDTALWSIVFPVGMYGVASDQLGRVTGAPWLVALGGRDVWVALAVWIIVFAAMLVAGHRWLRGDGGGRGDATS